VHLGSTLTGGSRIFFVGPFHTGSQSVCTPFSLLACINPRGKVMMTCLSIVICLQITVHLEVENYTRIELLSATAGERRDRSFKRLNGNSIRVINYLSG
jgi:hypothetical protein